MQPKTHHLPGTAWHIVWTRPCGVARGLIGVGEDDAAGAERRADDAGGDDAVADRAGGLVARAADDRDAFASDPGR